MDDAFVVEMLSYGPNLRAFAVSLTKNSDRADDLVQETYVRALANKSSFTMGSNMAAWLFTILRNLFRSDYRKRRREVEDAEGEYAKTLKTRPNQDWHMDFQDLREAIDTLPQDQREALILVGARGFSYEDSAQIADCATGTIKSRVNRARVKLAQKLGFFELRELNKKSWDDQDPEHVSLDKTDAPAKPSRKPQLWRETARATDSFYSPPSTLSPVRSISIASYVPISARERITIGNIVFELAGTTLLQTGQLQKSYLPLG